MNKPLFVSEVEIKNKTLTRFVCLPGEKDPMITFNPKRDSILDFLKKQNIKVINDSFGVYYIDRRKYGVEKVKWDACVPVRQKIEVEKPFLYKELPACKVSSVILTGGYDLIGKALEWMEYRLKEMNIEAKWPLIEIYVKEEDTPITELQYTMVS